MAVAPRFGVIWLHGLGDTGRGWSFLEAQLGPPLTRAIGGQIAWRCATCHDVDLQQRFNAAHTAQRINAAG